MGGFVTLLGLSGLVLGIIGLVKGSVPRVRIANRRVAAIVLVVGLVLIGVSASPQKPGEAQDEPVPVEEPEEVEEPVEAEQPAEEELLETELTVALQEEEKVLIVEGDTNLPDGSLIAWEAEHLQNPNFWQDGDTAVQDGNWEATVNVADWPAGEIEVWAGFDPGQPGQADDAEQHEDADVREGIVYMPPPSVYEGSGSDYFAIEPPGDPFMLSIQGNTASRHFAITGYDADGARTELFVNTTEPYEGITLDMEETRQLEIDAHGEWHIELHSILDAETVSVPGEVEGAGDYVFITEGEPSAADIVGNRQERHFAVHGYGQRRHLLVNTTEEYDGRVRVPDDVALWKITAVGEWNIHIE